MKKLALILVIAVIIAVIPANVSASAPRVGDVIGSVRHTDIRTFINGEQIPSYNINNRSVVLIADLRNYGFDVTYNDQTRTSTVARNFDKLFTPIQNIAINAETPGTLAFNYLHTDITAVVNSKVITSYNVQGNLAIYFGDLGDYGTFTWNSETRESRLTLFGRDVDMSALDGPVVGGEPVRLADLEPFADGWGWRGRGPYDERRANTGDLYKDCFSFDSWSSYTVNRDYLLNRQYTSIQGTVIIEYDGRAMAGEFRLRIFGDDELLYESGAIASGTMPFNFRVDLRGVNVMIIQVECITSWQSIAMSLSEVTLFK
jgi:hypothetical protein